MEMNKIMKFQRVLNQRTPLDLIYLENKGSFDAIMTMKYGNKWKAFTNGGTMIDGNDKKYPDTFPALWIGDRENENVFMFVEMRYFEKGSNNKYEFNLSSLLSLLRKDVKRKLNIYKQKVNTKYGASSMDEIFNRATFREIVKRLEAIYSITFYSSMPKEYIGNKEKDPVKLGKKKPSIWVDTVDAMSMAMVSAKQASESLRRQMMQVSHPVMGIPPGQLIMHGGRSIGKSIMIDSLMARTVHQLPDQNRVNFGTNYEEGTIHLDLDTDGIS